MKSWILPGGRIALVLLSVYLLTACSGPLPAPTTIAAVSPTATPGGAYFGQTPPGLTAEIFAPGLISLPDRRETKIVFSPDGQEAFLGTPQLFYARQENGHWLAFAPADFLGAQDKREPFISPDGQTLFFIRDAHVWMSAKVNGAWSTPVKLAEPVNSQAEEWHPTVTSDGTLYFGSTRNSPSGGLHLYRSRLVDGQYSQVEELDATINSQSGAWDPFIAPDESYLIFSSSRPDGYGQNDQYISYRRNNGWSNPKNLGPAINTDTIEYGSYISPDGQYYFFSRTTGFGPNIPADIYWIDSRAVLSANNNP